MLSDKLKEYGKNPAHRGIFFQEEASAKGLAFLTAKVGDMKIFWLLDPVDETVVNAKFFTYGGPDSLALGEAISVLAEGSSIQRAFAISGEDVAATLADANYYPFNKRDLMSQTDYLIAMMRQDHPLALAKLAMALKMDGAGKASSDVELSQEDEKWLGMPKSEQIAMIERVIDNEIRGALQVDGGDIEIVDIKNGWDIYAEFKGACTSCSASVGSTFLVVENVIKNKLNQKLNLVANSFPW
ncbi:MAG: NifU family protein [Nitrospinota bacterium]|nr:NifU family protein [Nitrospinota bacterium]